MASNEQFYSRMNQLAGIKPVNESKTEANARTLVDTLKADNGTVYGIVKENHQYHIKKAYVTEGEPNVTDFTYIDGVENKGSYQYKTLAEAEKQRNFYVKGINEAFDQGGVYFVNENQENENPSMDTTENFSSLVKRTISEGKKNLAESREKKFKSSLPEEKTETKKTSLMSEAATTAIGKALGKINEDAPFTEKPKGEGDEVTADSEIKDGDKVSEKKGKEAPQAPINDSNAKANAEKATGKSKKDANKKPAATDSIAVNQEDDVLKEGEDIITADSEIIADDSMANKVSQKHEPAQAPINDTNAKAHADKAMATGGATDDSAMSNQTEEQKESDPFDDKEDKGDEKGDIVTEDADKGQPFDDKAKVKSSGDEVTADSDQADGDRVDNETKVEKADAKYHNHNQPDEGHKEEKGEELKSIASEKDIVAEEAANALVDLISEGTESGKEEQKESDPFDDKEKAGEEKGDIVAEGEVEDAMVDKDAEVTAKADMKADGVSVTEGEDLSTADSEINADESPANSKSNIEYNEGSTQKDASYKMNDNAIAEGDAKEQPESDPFDDKEEAGEEKGDIVAENLDEAGEEEIDAAAGAVANLDAAQDVEDAAEEVPAEEPTMDMGDEGEVPANAEVEEPAAEGGGGDALGDDSGDLVVKEIEKLVGKTTQKIRNAELEPETAEGFLKSIVSSFEDKLPEMDLEDRKEVSDKILKADDADLEGGEEVAADAEVELDAEVPAEEPAGDFDSIEGDTAPAEEPAIDTVGEDAPMQVNGEDFVEEECNECGTFETYMESRGYSADNLAECSVAEMGNLVSGYISDNEGLDEAEIESIAGYMNNEVCEELVEYGHGDFAEKAKPFIKEDGVSFGMTEPTLPTIEMEEEDEEASEEEGGEEVVAVEVPAEEETPEEETPEVPFGAPAEVMGGGVVKPDGAKTKSVEVDVNAGTVKLEVSENAKVKEYIQNKLQELAGKKKPTMNESEKSENLKKLDKLIEQQWKLAGDKLSK